MNLNFQISLLPLGKSNLGFNLQNLDGSENKSPQIALPYISWNWFSWHTKERNQKEIQWLFTKLRLVLGRICGANCKWTVLNSALKNLNSDSSHQAGLLSTGHFPNLIVCLDNYFSPSKSLNVWNRKVSDFLQEIKYKESFLCKIKHISFL